MKVRVSFLILVFLCFMPLSVGAKGTQEKDFQTAKGKDNFSQSVDLSNLAPGQYNILVRTKDAAGNVSFAGPFNFYYDPASDNPLITIANPSPGMRVGGSQNIVGVASAPKGMDKVEVSLNGGEWIPAQGKAFWSFYFNSTGLPDGLHKINVRGTDINGVTGPDSSVSFHLDQNLPQFTLVSQKSGDRVQGVIPIEGTLVDGNGLQSLNLSLDSGKTVVPLTLQGDPKATQRSFSTTLDTRRFADGPIVVWFQGTDLQGSSFRQAVLLFVDNTVPQIEVLSPAPTKGLHGKVRFALRVEKALGIRSLTARVGEKGAPVSLAVVPGNPFHFVDLELPTKGSTTIPVIFEAVDTAGKVGRAVFQARLNGDTDLPEILLASALDKTQVKAPLRLVGSLKATDGPSEILWSLNGAPAVRESVGESFDFAVPGLITGQNKLVLIPVDANNKLGNPVTLGFTAVLEPPSIRIETLRTADQEIPFRPGIAVSPDKKTQIKGTLTWPNPQKSVTYTLGGKVYPLAVSGSTKAASLPFEFTLPEDPPFGTVTLQITATDLYDQTTTIRSWLDITNLAKPQGPEGMAFADPRMGAKPLVLTPETPLRGYFSGGKIRSADLVTAKGTVPTSVMQVTHEDQYVLIKALKDGQFEGVILRVITDKGRIFDTELGTLMGDTAAPAIGLSFPLLGAWVKENLRIDGQVSDINGLAKLEWSIDNGKTWQQLDPPGGQGGPFTRQFTLPGPDNMVNLLIRATDTAGRTGTVLTVVRRDTQGPTIDLTLPALTAGAQGVVYAVGRLKDEALQKAEVVIAKKTLPLPLDRPFVLPLDAETAGGSQLMFRVVDWAGNVTEQNFTIPIPPPPPAEAPKPEIQILFPKADTKELNGIVPVIGRVTGFTSMPQLSSKGEAVADLALKLTEAGYFSFETNVSTLKSRSVSLTATGEGKETATVNFTLPFDAASELPQARFLAQPEKPVLSGYVSASGWIGDSRGVVSWISQLDSGEKKVVVPDPAKPPVGVFLIDVGVPSIGPHKLTVTPVNAAGKEGVPAVTEFISTTPSGPVEFTSFDLGAPMVVSKDSRIQGRVPSINSWRKLEIRFADLTLPDPWNGPFQPLEAKKNGDGVWSFDVPVPDSLPYSRIGVVVRGEDSLGQKIEGRTLFHKVWLKEADAIDDREGLFFIDSLLDSSGRFNTVPGSPLKGTFRGRPVKTLTLTPPIPALSAKLDGTVITVDAKEEGLFGPFTLSITTIDNETFTAPPMSLFADVSGPVLDWEVPLNAEWIRDTISVSGKVTDPSGVASLDLSVDGGTSWQPLAAKNGVFDTKVPATGPDGLTRLMLRAADNGGHVSTETRVVTKDSTAPEWTLVAPPETMRINGLTTIIALATDLNPIDLIEFSDDGKRYQPVNGLGLFAFDLDFASYTKIPEQIWIRSSDTAGNTAVRPMILPVDQEADKPTVQIQTPAEGEVVRADFSLSGMAFDDDGVKALSWRIDQGPWLRLEGVSSFQIPVALASLTDNEHTVEVQAEDIYGVKGDIFRSVFKVSLEAPSAILFTPEIDKTVSGTIGLVGASMDRNGLQTVQVSLDNGLTWNRAELKLKEEILANSNLLEVKSFLPSQRQEWEWRFDSKTLKDGTYLVMVRSTDKYGTVGLHTTLVNLDNTAPTLILTTPSDGQPVLDLLDLQGRSSDNIKMLALHAELRTIEGPVDSGKGPTGTAVLQLDLPVTPTFNTNWNIGPLTPGWYNLRLEAKDAAGNATYVARNVRIEGSSADKVEILYPQSGESLFGSFLLEGKVTSKTLVEKALVNLDGKIKVVVDVNPQGFFQVVLDGSQMEKGDHSLVVSVQVSEAVTLTSEQRRISFDPLGPWIKITSHHSGSYVTQRPFISGLAGWNALPQELHRISVVEGSLDNGKTFSPAQGTEDWKFRLETLNLPDGPQPLLFRVKFQDGSVAIQRMLVTVSQTPPTLQLLTPIENGRFNGTLELAGFTEGDGEVSAVEVAVRQGDKAGYQVPTFIQGMYLDGHFGGATTWEVGLGLTFFQDAVKLQAQLGQTPFGRFWGTVAGGKLIASIAQLPAGFFFGPDWAWLSTSFGIGANFSQFSMNANFLDFGSTAPVMLGGVVFQWETFKAVMSNLTFFKSYSWYNEATVWFISSDVQAESVWVFSTGVRVGIF